MYDINPELVDWLEGQIFGGDKPADILEKSPALSVADAYRLRDALTRRRETKGERLIGYKVAGASKALQAQEHVEGPIVGCMMQSCVYPRGAPIPIGAYKRTSVEPEVAVLLKSDLAGPGVTPATALAAIEGYFAAIEVVAVRDSSTTRSHQMRILGSKFSGGGIVLGSMISAPHGVDLRLEGMVITVNGEVRGSAAGVEVMGDPLNAVALMANTMAECGVTLKAGMLLMTGSFMGHVAVAPGDEVMIEFTRLGSVGARFAK